MFNCAAAGGYRLLIHHTSKRYVVQQQSALPTYEHQPPTLGEVVNTSLTVRARHITSGANHQQCKHFRQR